MNRSMTMLAVGLVGMLLAVAASQLLAEATGVAPTKQLLDEARKLYAAHNYDGALRRLQQVDRADLGFLEKGTFDSLLKNTQKAVEGKAAAEKAFTEGKDALEKKRYATAIDRLSVAAGSEYLEDEKSGPAQGLLQLANDEHAGAVADARTRIAKAQAALKDGRADNAAALIKGVEAMDVRLDAAERNALAAINKDLAAPAKPVGAVAAAAPARPLGLAPVVQPIPPTPAPAKPLLVASAESAPAAPAAPAATAPVAPAAPAPVAPVVAATPAAPAATAPAARPAAAPVPAAPTASALYEQAKKAYADRKFADAQKLLQKVDRSQLGFFERAGFLGIGGFDEFVRSTDRAVQVLPVDEKSLADGKDALTKKRYAVATAELSKAASSKYLSPDKVVAANTLYETAKAEEGKAVAAARDMMDKAKAELREGKTADARKTVGEIKAMDVDLGSFGNSDLASLDRKIKVVEAEASGIAARPVAVAKGPAAPAATKAPAAAPIAPVAVAAAPTAPVAPKAAATPTAAATPRPVAAPTGTAVAAAPRATKAPALAPEAEVSLAAQARRAEAEDAAKLGNDFLARREFEKAKVQYLRALNLWPDAPDAKDGLDKCMKFLAEREPDLSDIYREAHGIQRQQIIASVQELIGQSEQIMSRAQRPEDYVEADQRLLQADRTIETARVLTPEESERYREEVFILRKEIKGRREVAEGKRIAQAETEAQMRERQRLEANRRDVQNKVAQLWQRATELRQSYQFSQAIDIMDRLLAVDPTDERALRWREDMLFYLAQQKQVDVRQKREYETAEALVETEEPLTVLSSYVKGRETYVRYPDAKEWKELTERRRAFMKAVSAEPKAVAETRRRLSEEIDLDFEKTSLDNVLKYIGEVQRGLNIVIDPDVAAATDLSTVVVDLKVKRVSIESVLNLILGANLGYKVEQGYILITTKEKMQQNLPMVTYPVQDLIAQIPDFSGKAPRFDISQVTAGAATAAGGAAGGGAGGLFGVAPAAAAAPEPTMGSAELIDIIKRTVSATSDPRVAAWADEGGPASIDFMNGMLIITQSRRGHERISELLDQLRRERAIMISVEARFAAVSDQFLQDISLDVDAVLASSRYNASTYMNPGANPVTDPGAIATGAGFNTLPGVSPTGTIVGQFAQPIFISQTSSNNQGLTKLLPLTGTAFANFTANEGGLAVSGVFLDDIQVGFLLRAIQADVRSTTLQAPRLTLFNGQRSYISMATIVSYISDVEPIVAEAAVGWRPQISAIPVGVVLDVKATVSADRRYVQMDLRPQLAGTPTFRTVLVSAAVPGGGIATNPIDLPTVAVQDIQTTVSVPDGGTLLLGGLRRFDETEAESGVPFLSKIPILKRLFDNRGTLRQATNTLILIRPKIIIQAEEEQKLGYDEF